jgi:CBS domain-containing protein
MRVRDLIDESRVVCLTPKDSVLAAARLMAEHHVGSVLITTKAGSIKGIFTERDLMVKVVAKAENPADTAIADVMTTDVHTTDPDQLVTDVRREMRRRHIRHIPVVQGKKVLTVLSMRDLTRADLTETRRDAAAMAAYIRGEGESV